MGDNQPRFGNTEGGSCLLIFVGLSVFVATCAWAVVYVLTSVPA